MVVGGNDVQRAQILVSSPLGQRKRNTFGLVTAAAVEFLCPTNDVRSVAVDLDASLTHHAFEPSQGSMAVGSVEAKKDVLLIVEVGHQVGTVFINGSVRAVPGVALARGSRVEGIRLVVMVSLHGEGEPVEAVGPVAVKLVIFSVNDDAVMSNVNVSGVFRINSTIESKQAIG